VDADKTLAAERRTLYKLERLPRLSLISSPHTTSVVCSDGRAALGRELWTLMPESQLLAYTDILLVFCNTHYFAP
jgi:hypothetical protein